MSDTGVYSSVYERVSHYGQVLDEVLMGLKADANSPIGAVGRELGELLVSLDKPRPSDISGLWFVMILAATDPKSRSEWAASGRELLAGKVSARVITSLEVLAQYLEQRRTDALSRMRGVNH